MKEETLLENFLGESSVLKILNVLMDHPSMDYSKKDLAEVTGMAESTVHRHWSRIEDMDAVEESRKYGKTTLYKLNQDSEIVKQLFKLDQELRKKADCFQVEKI